MSLNKSEFYEYEQRIEMIDAKAVIDAEAVIGLLEQHETTMVVDKMTDAHDGVFVNFIIINHGLMRLLMVNKSHCNKQRACSRQ